MRRRYVEQGLATALGAAPRLLADKAVERCLVETISHETVGQVLKKTKYSPTASSTGAWG